MLADNTIFYVLILLASGIVANGAKPDKAKMCEHFPKRGSNGLGVELEPGPWTDTPTKETYIELAASTIGYSHSHQAFVPVDILPWRRVTLSIIANIAKKSCNPKFVSDSFITGLTNLFAYYIAQYKKTNIITEQQKVVWDNLKHKQSWTEIIGSLSSCASRIPRIVYERGIPNEHLDCHKLESFYAPVGDNEELKWFPLPGYVNETLDETYAKHETADVIIDGVWWLFSIAFARCYGTLFPNEYLVQLFLTRFQKDILDYFHKRWFPKALKKNFDLLFGPVSTWKQLRDLRMCANIAFAYEGMGHDPNQDNRILVRPSLDNKKV